METETLVTTQETFSQKDAVFIFAVQALDGTPPDPRPLRARVTKEVRKSIRRKLFDGVKSGSVKLSRSMDDSKLKKYCSSLINNWLKKDSRFN